MADLRFAEQNWAEAAALYRAVLAAKPDARDAARRAHIAEAMNHLALGGFDEAIEHATEAARLDPEQAGRSVVQFCQKLFLSDARSQQISDFLDEVLQLAPEDPWLRRLKRQAPSANRMEARAPFLREIQHNGYVVKEVPGASCAVLILGGVGGARRFPRLESQFEKIGAHAVYLADRRNLIFAGGIEQLGRNHEETMVKLAEICDRLNAERLLTVGFSAGGFAAVRYALDLGAYGAITFSGPTTFAAEDYASDRRGFNTFPRIRRIAGEHMGDLKPLLLRRKPPLQLVCVFGEKMAIERWHAERIADVPGVALADMEDYAEHGTGERAVASGAFARMISAMARGASADEVAALIKAPDDAETADEPPPAARRARKAGRDRESAAGRSRRDRA